MRYYHGIALAAAVVALALGAGFPILLGSLVLYAVGLALAVWVGNALRRVRNQTKADAWRDEGKPWWRQQSVGWRGSAAVTAIILGGTVAMLVVTLAGGLSAGSGPHTYKDSLYNFTFTYPASWRIGEYRDMDPSFRVGVVDPEGTKLNAIDYMDAVAVSAGRLGPNEEFSPTNTAVDEVLAALRTVSPDARLTQPLSQTPVDNQSAWTWSVALTMDGVPVNLRVHWLFSSGVFYEVYCQASQANWAADTAIFDSILASFQVP
jgi:hypothetical protein